LLFFELVVDFGEAGFVVEADDGFLVEDGDFGFEGVDAFAAVIDLGGDGVLADGDARGGGVDELDGLVGELAGGDVAGAELDGGFEGLVEDLDFVVFFKGGGGARIMRMALRSPGSSILIFWKRRVRAGSFSMCFLYSSQVVAATVRRVPRARAGLRSWAASPVPPPPPAPIIWWASSMKRMMGLGRIGLRR